MKSLSQHINESFVSEDSDSVLNRKLKGTAFKYQGSRHMIKKIEDGIIHTDSGKLFNYDTLKNKFNVDFWEEPAKVKKEKQPSQVITKAKYQKMLKDAMSNVDFDGSVAYDLADSMYLDQDIQKRLFLDYPMLRSDAKYKERLQWDLEAFSK